MESVGPLKSVDDPRAIAWIEHCEGAPSPAAPWNGETWDEVTMDWDGTRFRSPSWRPCAGDRFKRPALGRSVRAARNSHLAPLAGQLAPLAGQLALPAGTVRRTAPTFMRSGASFLQR